MEEHTGTYEKSIAPIPLSASSGRVVRWRVWVGMTRSRQERMNFLRGITLSLLCIASAAGQAAAANQLLSEQAFKNVTVLKGIPVDEFMNTMGLISAATNYNCADCHVEPKVEGDWSAYAQDTPRKVTARKMILMVQDINKNNFSGARVVTCYT